ncbi:hypothetical protein DFJ58DRAFT_96238 [Suillus subalutaceus]|uniref:uncharacterized protein n=1 Tax=Suillus subalutaceus TaxID=48586 RepID=UPI001B885ED4|nr:uncharacterized protein DFJ58DRAFT_96238 [Suillus subalutaceus]KAG1839968.1 hypothetical protein DFJ58DRAFT_96238 [Suillus subalutaceus]
MFQIFFFPPLHARPGKKSYVCSVAFGIPIPSHQRSCSKERTYDDCMATCRRPARTWSKHELGLRYALSKVSRLMGSCAACVFMFIATATPNRRYLGAANEFSQMIISIVRTSGPALADAVFSFSIQHPRFPWLIHFIAFLALGASLSLCIPSRIVIDFMQSFSTAANLNHAFTDLDKQTCNRLSYRYSILAPL